MHRVRRIRTGNTTGLVARVGPQICRRRRQDDHRLFIVGSNKRACWLCLGAGRHLFALVVALHSDGLAHMLLEAFARPASEPRLILVEDSLNSSSKILIDYLASLFPATPAKHIHSLGDAQGKEAPLLILSAFDYRALLRDCIQIVSSPLELQRPQSSAKIVILVHRDCCTDDELQDLRYVVGSWIAVKDDGTARHDSVPLDANFKLGAKMHCEALRLSKLGPASFKLELRIPSKGERSTHTSLDSVIRESTFSLFLSDEQARQRAQVELPYLSAQHTHQAVPYVYDSEDENE